MRPPSKVKVGHHVYSIIVSNDEELWDNPFAAMKGFLYGECQHRNNRIMIRKGISDQQVRTTIWHEILHACVAVHGGLFDIWMPAEEQEEFVISSMEALTLSVLRDNPRLVAYLTEKP